MQLIKTPSLLEFKKQYDGKIKSLLESVDSKLHSNVLQGNFNGVTPLTEEWNVLCNTLRESLNEGVIELEENVKWVLENTYMGAYAMFEEELVPLDFPLINEERKGYNSATQKTVTFDKPTRATDKKDKAFKVYRPAEGYHTTADGKKIRKAKVIYFGDPDNPIRNYDAEASKSFRARHKCSQKKDKDTPGWWSCNIARFPSAGLSSTKPW